MKLQNYICALSLALIATSCSLTSTDGRGGASFVTVHDGKFWQGEQEYRFVGTNFWYGAILASEGRGGNRDRLLKELDLMQSVGIDNVRVLVGGDGREGIPSHIMPKLQTEPGVYNDTLLQGLDFLMAELEQRDMKAVLFLNNAWEWSGGYGAYLDWVGFEADVQSSKEPGKTVHFDRTPVPSIEGWWEYMQYVSNFVLNDSAKALANQHLQSIVGRTNTVTGKPYSESKALMAWEIANEPRCFADDSLHKAKFVEWIDEQSTMIKQLDPNHLVTTGSEGLHGCQEDMQLFTAIHTLPNIDYACIHIWPNNWGWLGQFNQNYDADKTIDADAPDPIVDRVQAACDSTRAYIHAASVALADAVSKDSLLREGRGGVPLVLEEFGYPRDRFLFTPGSLTRGRDAYYKYVFDIIASTGEIAGCNFWGWGGLADVKHTIWQPFDDYVCDPAQEEQGLNSVFACDSSTMKLIHDMNLAPRCVTLLANDSDWVWYGNEPFVLDVPVTNLAGKPQHTESITVRIAKDTGEELYTATRTKVDIPFTFHIEADSFSYAPGFYHITVEVDGQNVVQNATEVYGGQLTLNFFNIGYEPEKIVSPTDRQPDFEAFWDEARRQLAATPLKPQVREIKGQPSDGKRSFNAIIQGLDGAPVQVYYTVPRKPGKYPVHIINMGYSSKPWPLDLTDNGWIDVIISSRGQGSNEETNPYGRWVQYGLQAPQTYYYRGAYLDCPRAIDYLCTLPEVDSDNIFLEGGSQGGAYSMACAALDHRVRAVACYITFMSDFPDYFRIAEWPYSDIHARQQELGITDDDLYKTLSYFDIKNLATWVQCPVFLGIGLQDITCPPHTNISGYNLLTVEKEFHIYQHYGHHVDYNHWNPAITEFFNKHKYGK